MSLARATLPNTGKQRLNKWLTSLFIQERNVMLVCERYWFKYSQARELGGRSKAFALAGRGNVFL